MNCPKNQKYSIFFVNNIVHTIAERQLIIHIDHTNIIADKNRYIIVGSRDSGQRISIRQILTPAVHYITCYAVGGRFE